MRPALACSILLMSASINASAWTMTTQSAQSVPDNSIKLDRRYREGEALRYEMKGSNHGWEYQIHADALVKKDDEGVFYEQISWSDLRSNAPMTLSPSSLDFRQTLSLAETSKYLTVPDLSKIQPILIGPITDMLTFYSDVFLSKQLKLSHVGQHAYFEHGTPNSWADGQRILLGEDSIDFDLTLVSADPAEHTATLLVRHVSPAHPQVHLPAEWMKAPVSDAPNNWVQVQKAEGKFVAEVGLEIFDVRVKLDTRNGKILSADLHNPVVAVRRTCEDPILSKCDAPKAETIVRDVSLTLVPESNGR